MGLQPVWKMGALCGLVAIIVAISIVSDCMASNNMPGQPGYDSAVFEDNEVYQNGFTGVRIRGSLPVRVKRCNSTSNASAGMSLEKDSQVVASDCNFTQNLRGGISVDGAARTTIENSKIHDNKKAGVRIRTEKANERRMSEVRIAYSRIYGNGEGGIRSMPEHQYEVDLAVMGNNIYKNEKGGIRVGNNTTLTAKANRVYENGAAGLISYLSETPPKLDIYQNSVSFNRGPGIHVATGVSGSIGIRNNRVFDNQLSGILCGLWGKPDIRLIDVEIINNTIVSNGSTGNGAGIRNDSKGRAVIMNNIIAYNYETGIRTRECRKDSYNLLFANGETGDCCKDAELAPYWIERLQFAGCAGRGTEDLIADPLFADPDNYDFTLQAESPAVDAGNSLRIYDDAFLPPSQGSNRNDIGATGGPYAAD